MSVSHWLPQTFYIGAGLAGLYVTAKRKGILRALVVGLIWVPIMLDLWWGGFFG